MNLFEGMCKNPRLGISEDFYTRQIGTDLDKGWNWAIYDSFSGTSYADLMFQSKSGE